MCSYAKASQPPLPPLSLSAAGDRDQKRELLEFLRPGHHAPVRDCETLDYHPLWTSFARISTPPFSSPTKTGKTHQVIKYHAALTTALELLLSSHVFGFCQSMNIL